MNAATEPDVSVIVATYNRCEVLRGALESLLDQEASGTTYEVIVADNNSTDDTRRVVDGTVSFATGTAHEYAERCCSNNRQDTSV